MTAALRSESVRLGVIAVVVALLAACSSPASREAMVPAAITAGKQHPYTVLVRTSGGSDTGALDSSNISDADLKAAIEESIARNRIFKATVHGSGGDYELNVRVVTLSKPVIGATFTVELEMAWSLVRVSDRATLLRKSISASGVASMSDAFAAVTRLRLAVERAAQENIAMGLREVAALSL